MSDGLQPQAAGDQVGKSRKSLLRGLGAALLVVGIALMALGHDHAPVVIGGFVVMAVGGVLMLQAQPPERVGGSG